MNRWVLGLIALLALGASACTADEDAGPDGAKEKRAAARPRAHAAAGPEADLRKALASRPSECDAGKNDRQVLAVRVTKQEQSESGGGKYRKVRGEATIVESGPCPENAGKHRWAAGITYVEEDDNWRLASFGFEQERLD